MEIDLFTIGVIYPNEQEAKERKFKLRTDGEILHFDFIDPVIETGSFYLDRDQVKILVDSLSMILKNKLIE
jgi:hypothetical protein